MEGITEYFAQLMLRRAGLWTVDEYLEGIAEDIRRLEQQPGRRWMSLAESSFDTWAGMFPPGADFPNRSISYYLKGSLVGLLLDLEIRRRTQNSRALDDVLRCLMDRYGAEGVGFPESVYQATVEEVAGGPMDEFFARYIDGVEELPLDDALRVAGLEIVRRIKNPDKRKTDDGDAPSDKPDEPYAWLGIACVGSDRADVRHVYEPGPAAGVLYPGDEIIAIEGIRVHTPDDVTSRIRNEFVPGSPVEVQLFRLGRLESVVVTAAEAPANEYKIRRLKEASQERQTVYGDWLRAEWPAEPDSMGLGQDP